MMNPTLVSHAKRLHHTKAKYLLWLINYGRDFARYTFADKKPRYAEIFTPAKDAAARVDLAAMLVDKSWILVDSYDHALATNPQEKPDRRYAVDFVHKDKNIIPVKYFFLARPDFFYKKAYKAYQSSLKP
jgi:hypothetical protein